MISLLISSAYAQDAGAAAAGPNGFFAPMLIIFAIFYFLIIRPQKKKLEEEKAMMASINKGDEIFTKSGLLGTVTGMTDKVITLEVAEGVKLKLLKSQIGGLAQKIFEPAKTEEKK